MRGVAERRGVGGAKGNRLGELFDDPPLLILGHGR
jgi:hypothetical protein